MEAPPLQLAAGIFIDPTPPRNAEEGSKRTSGPNSATREDCLPSFASEQKRKQTKPEKNMMPATNDDLAGKEAAQNKDARTTSRQAGTRKPRSSSSKMEQEHPPSSSKKSNEAPLQLAPGACIAPTPPQNAEQGSRRATQEAYLAKYGDDSRSAASANMQPGNEHVRPTSTRKHQKDNKADATGTNRVAFLTKDARRGTRNNNTETTIVEPARPGAVRIAGTNASPNDDKRANSWSVLPPFDDLEQLELELELGIEHDSPDCTIEAELAPDLQDIKAEIEERMQQENADRLEREREMQVEIAEATEVKPYTEDQTYDRKVCGLSKTILLLLLLGMVFLVVVVGAVAVLVLTKGDGNERTTSPSSSPSTSISPSTSPSTSAPTTAPTMKLDYLRNWLGPLVTANATLFQDPSTPQYEALDWLAYRGGFFMPEQVTPNAESYRYIERYVAALLFFSSNMRVWVGEISVWENVSVCKWNYALQGFLCDDGPFMTRIDLGMCDCERRFFDF
jgi:hypothetical protein